MVFVTHPSSGKAVDVAGGAVVEGGSEAAETAEAAEAAGAELLPEVSMTVDWFVVGLLACISVAVAVLVSDMFSEVQ